MPPRTRVTPALIQGCSARQVIEGWRLAMRMLLYDARHLVGSTSWPAVALVARANGLLPALAPALRRCGAPAALQEEATHASACNAARQSIVMSEMCPLVERLCAGSGALLLKGAASAFLLAPAPYMREWNDVDLLVPRDQRAGALGLLRSHGFVASGRGWAPHHGWPMVRACDGEVTLCVEVHTRIAPATSFPAPAYADLERCAVPVPAWGKDVRGLGAADAAIHALVHACVGLRQGRVYGKSAWDWALGRERCSSAYMERLLPALTQVDALLWRLLKLDRDSRAAPECPSTRDVALSAALVGAARHHHRLALAALLLCALPLRRQTLMVAGALNRPFLFAGARLLSGLRERPAPPPTREVNHVSD